MPKLLASGGFFEHDDLLARSQEPGQAPLPMGLFVQASIQGRTVESVFELPRTALRQRNEVLVVDDDDRLRVRRVDVPRSDRSGAGFEPGSRRASGPSSPPSKSGVLTEVLLPYRGVMYSCVLFASFITLFIVPATYLLLEDLEKLASRLWALRAKTGKQLAEVPD